jgi:sulfite exporter TauE/SafE
VGWALAQATGQWPLRLCAGGLLVVMGLYLGGWWHGLLRLERLGQGLWAYIRPLTGQLLPVASLRAAVALGMLWGWLPCGLVYSTLLWAASQGQPGHGGVLMLAFGLGTMPLLLVTGMAGAGAQRWLKRRGVRQAAGGLLIAFGAWTCAAVLHHQDNQGTHAHYRGGMNAPANGNGSH